VAGRDAEDGNDERAGDDAAAHDGQQTLPGSTTASGGNGTQAPQRSKHTPATKVTWWESNLIAYVAVRPAVGGTSDFDLT